MSRTELSKTFMISDDDFKLKISPWFIQKYFNALTDNDEL